MPCIPSNLTLINGVSHLMVSVLILVMKPSTHSSYMRSMEVLNFVVCAFTLRIIYVGYKSSIIYSCKNILSDPQCSFPRSIQILPVPNCATFAVFTAVDNLRASIPSTYLRYFSSFSEIFFPFRWLSNNRCNRQSIHRPWSFGNECFINILWQTCPSSVFMDNSFGARPGFHSRWVLVQMSCIGKNVLSALHEQDGLGMNTMPVAMTSII